MKTRAADYSSYVLFCNLVGGQDELVFDGTSSVISPWGDTEARAPLFKEYILIKDIDITQVYLKRVHDPRRRTEKPSTDSKIKVINLDLSITQKDGETKNEIYDFPKWEEEVFCALVTGTRDYILKNRFSKALIALSGGIDSSLTACIATEAIGPENVLGISMPSQFSSHHSVEDAEILSKNLGIKFLKIPIMRIYEAFMNELSELFAGTPFSSAEENLQARIRGNIIMTISNKFGHIVLACGNKSEMSVGYATLYGDLAGGFAVIKDLYKTDVYKIAKFYNEMKGREIIPKRVFEKPPSAELRPNQKDEDDLPPYRILDAILKLYIEKDTPPEIIEKVVGVDKQTIKRVIEMVEKAEYKRRQAPPGIKISSRAFGKDRRMPITKKIDCILKF
jgi:NAD+ synthase (glutamine-hydrolysing)